MPQLFEALAQLVTLAIDELPEVEEGQQLNAIHEKRLAAMKTS
jgi:hypothetical protein